MHWKTTYPLAASATLVLVTFAIANPPRYHMKKVPPLLDGASGGCCYMQATGWNKDGTMVGIINRHAGDGTYDRRGVLWRAGEEPVELSQESWAPANPFFVTDSGWIGGRGMPIDADECTLNRHIFVQPPNGEMVNLTGGISCDEFVPEFVDMTEEGALLFTKADAQNQWAKNPFIMYPDGSLVALECGEGVDYSPVLCGASADGSVIGASIHGASFLRPGRWVDGSFELLLTPGPLTTWYPGATLGVGPDGSIVSTTLDLVSNKWRPTRWNREGEVDFLPVPLTMNDAGVQYLWDDLAVGWAFGDSSMPELAIWHLEDDEVVQARFKEFPEGTDEFMSWVFGEPVHRAGDHIIAATINWDEYRGDLFVAPIHGGEVRLLHELIVHADDENYLSVGPDMWVGIQSIFAHAENNSFVVNRLVGDDVVAFILERLRPGDVNGDHFVDGADIADLLGAWGTDDRAADLDRDGIVDGVDLSIAISDWG